MTVPKIERADNLMSLTRAIKVLKDKYPWIPIWSLRQAVIDGRVPCIRGSDKKGARYYVRLEDLVEYALPKHEPQSS
jgi:hypothetical protein